jgi:SAM-dependent methyltransferase
MRPAGTSWVDRRLRPRPTQANFLLLRTLARQLEQAIALHLRPRGPVDVLDVGCGSKPYEQLFEGVARRYVGVDVAPGPAVDVVGSADALPFADGRFDVVLCSQVLEHVERPPRVLAEIHRVLRPGGVALLSTHGVVRYHGTADRRPDDFRRWTWRGLDLEFRQAAHWQQIDVVPNGGTGSALAFVIGRELEVVLGAVGLRRVAAPLFVALNAVGWRLDVLAQRRYPDRVPELACNYLVVARRP